jgi:hypothetical protein
VIKLFLLVAFTFIVSENIYAGPFKCRGTHYNNQIEIKGIVPGATVLDSSTGTVYVNGREVAFFGAGELSVNLIMLSFKAKNNHGDTLDGKVVDLENKAALIKRLHVPGYGIDFNYFHLNCK